MEEKLIKQRETILLNEYAHSGSLVYIIKVKTFSNGEYVIKIGHRRDVHRQESASGAMQPMSCRSRGARSLLAES